MLSPAIDKILTFLHTFFFSFIEELQEELSKLFEKLWVKKYVSRDKYAANMCIYLLARTLRLDKRFNAYMNRLFSLLSSVIARNAIRESVKLIDFSSPQSSTARAMVLTAFRTPQFIAHNHGKRLLSM